VSADAAWFESEFPARLQALLAGDTYKLEYSPTSAADVALIPHLDTLTVTHQGVTLKGWFKNGTEAGMVEWAGLAPWPIPGPNWSQETVFVRYQGLDPNYQSLPTVGQFRVWSGGVKSNPLAFYATNCFSGHTRDGDYWIEIHVMDRNHQATSVRAVNPQGGLNAPLDWVPGNKSWFVNLSLPDPPPADPTCEIRIEGNPPARFGARVLGYCNEFPRVVWPPNGAVVEEFGGLSWERAPHPEWQHVLHLWANSEELVRDENVSGTSLAYTGPALVEGQSYVWMIHAADPDTGNLAADGAVFLYQPREEEPASAALPLAGAPFARHRSSPVWWGH